MPFWEGLSRGSYISIFIKRGFEDLGYAFVPGKVITVEILNGAFYRFGMHMIPKSHCEIRNFLD